MINRKKKYKEATSIPYPSIGPLLEQVAQQNHLNKSEVARMMGVTPKVIGDYFKKNSMQMGIIWNLSIVFHHNFIAQIAQQMPIAFETKAEAALKNEITALKDQIEKLELELVVYKKIMNSKW